MDRIQQRRSVEDPTEVDGVAAGEEHHAGAVDRIDPAGLGAVIARLHVDDSRRKPERGIVRERHAPPSIEDLVPLWRARGGEDRDGTRRRRPQNVAFRLLRPREKLSRSEEQEPWHRGRPYHRET